MGYMNKWITFLLLTGLWTSCNSSRPLTDIPSGASPDYSLESSWGALPGKVDFTDKIPKSLASESSVPEVDVFFLHPTTYTEKKKVTYWNGRLDDVKLREKTETTTLQFQASIFNKAGHVYAPFYRQAHINAYFTNEKEKAKATFELAYQDVREAFKYYLSHYHNDKPIIIASHSQGTNHAERLIKEFFDGKPLAEKLVAAYLIGMPIKQNAFQQIVPCENATQTGCFVSWRTWKENYSPATKPGDEEVVVVNPLTWNRSKDRATKELNKGAVLLNFDKVLPAICDAKIKGAYLEVSHPKFPGSFLYRSNNYHIADFNLFYLNVRENALSRVASYKLNHTPRNP
ncbi:MAG: DUF3089 domain-containing protein [Bacteroidetes bacterium]|nr:DUF3089 domain-containing protein [Bacteroidota bacterium]